MKIDDGRMRAMHGYEEGKIDAVDTASSSLALSYKKDFLKHFIPITRQQIGRRLTGNRYYVTRKYDGEYAIIFHDGGQTVTINRSGRVRRGIPCIEEAGRLLDAAGIRQAVVPAEIYVEAGQGRGRLNALLSALADRRRIGSLRLAVFDLLETDGKPVRGSYGEIWKRLEGIFSGGKLVHPVEMEVAASAEGVEAIYDDWVEREGGEGLVVRNDGPFVYKIKPRHSLDAVVVGFSEGTGSMKGQVRSLLLALMPAEGRYQVVGRVGSGLTEEMRETLYSRFSREVIPSEYIVTDMDYVAFRMIRPETVIELTAGDLLYETESGPKQNTVLRIEANAYRIAATVDGVKLLAPVFVRVRMDKRADASDVRLAQIERFTASFDPTTAQERPAPESLPVSTLLFREVYLKTLGGKTMVQKFMVWKTNKEQTGEYPAFVLYHANFSPGRADPLRREVKVSSNAAQIGRLLRESLEQNVRGGWSKAATFHAARNGASFNGTPEPDRTDGGSASAKNSSRGGKAGSSAGRKAGRGAAKKTVGAEKPLTATAALSDTDGPSRRK